MENQPDLSKISLNDLIDCAILAHGLTPYKRDYSFHIEVLWKENYAGQYLVLFKHCCESHFKLTITSEGILESWDDKFIDYSEWENAGSPEGYVWGTNFMCAYPGFRIIEDSIKASKWSSGLCKEMKELQVEAEIFQINLIFHDWSIRKLNNETGTVSKYIIPLKPY